MISHEEARDRELGPVRGALILGLCYLAIGLAVAAGLIAHAVGK